MRIVPEAFFQNPRIQKLMRDGDCAVIHKYTDRQDLDNHRLLSAHALTLVNSGGLMVHNDEGLPTRVNEGQMVLLPKGLYAITDLIPEGEGFEAMVFFFDDELIATFLASQGMGNMEVFCEPKPALFKACDSFLVFTEQLQSLYGQVAASQPMVRIKLLEALHLIVQRDPENHFLDRIQELRARPKKELSFFMNAHYDKPLDVEDFARLSGRSVSTFRRDFHKQFGTAPKQWLITRRLEKARELLSSEGASVAAVAQASGYTDLPHFIKSFQKEFAISPKQFALTQRN